MGACLCECVLLVCGCLRMSEEVANPLGLRAALRGWWAPNLNPLGPWVTAPALCVL